MMSIVEPKFQLKSNKLAFVKMDFLNDDNISEGSIVTGFAEGSEDFDKNNMISIKVEIDIPVEDIRFQISVLTEIEVLDKDNLTYQEIIEKEGLEFMKPGFGKASLVISQLYESVTGFPNIYDLTELLKETE